MRIAQYHHGHNHETEVIAAGEPDKETGAGVMDVKLLSDIIRERSLSERFDHKESKPLTPSNF